MGTVIIVGQGLAGTLAAWEARARGIDFVVVDEDSGATASRAAAGLLNPLTGPRFSPASEDWAGLIPFYRRLEQTLGTALIHPLPLYRPLEGAKVGPEHFPRSAPGWSAAVEPGSDGAVRIDGGGWVDLPALLDASRARWLVEGRLEGRRFTDEEGRGKEVVWCAGAAGLGGVWTGQAAGRWQPVRGDVLTVQIPGPGPARRAEVGPRFLLPLGGDRYRWGATHEADVGDQEFRPDARRLLEDELARYLGHRGFTVTGHAWGVRPASRNHRPMVERHRDEPGWRLFNGLGGRGVSQGPEGAARLWEL